MVCNQFIISEFKKTQYVQFMTKNTSINEISLGYNNMFISNTSNAKFLGLIITNSLSWKDHITQLISKLSKACYVLWCIRPFMSHDALKSVYYYFHSPISYGVILHTVLISFNFKRRQLESLRGQDQGILVENYLSISGSYNYSLSTYFNLCFSL
jgi:hypothetical protein